MGRAELRFLNHHFRSGSGQRRLNLFAAIACNDHGSRHPNLANRTKQVHQHRMAGDWVQHLVQVAFHAGSLARGKDDDGKWLAHSAAMPPNACRFQRAAPRGGR